MFPTIDFSNLGVAVGIGAVLRHIVSTIVEASNWVAQKVIAVVAGSKLWATAAFVATAIVLLGFVSTFIGRLASWGANLVIERVADANDLTFEFGVANKIIPFGTLADLISFSFGFWSGIFAIDVYYMYFRLAFQKYMTLMQAWKT